MSALCERSNGPHISWSWNELELVDGKSPSPLPPEFLRRTAWRPYGNIQNVSRSLGGLSHGRTMMLKASNNHQAEEMEIEAHNQTLELIGDGSQPYALPTLNAKYDRFKRIDTTTLVKLIDGHFKDSVESFTIIDCRYPYEYQGGHILNSLNIHTGPELLELFIEKQQASSQGRHILIFHCEFSSERGPRLMKLLRERDRQINKYPQLLHPELYLLEGGYREFYRNYKEYCVPQSYKPMKSHNHRDELSKYRRRRKKTNPRRKENSTIDISFE